MILFRIYIVFFRISAKSRKKGILRNTMERPDPDLCAGAGFPLLDRRSSFLPGIVKKRNGKTRDISAK